MSDNFYYQGKFFEKEDDFWEYVNEWPILKTDQETFERMWETVGKNLWLNIQMREIQMLNREMDEILQQKLIELLEIFFNKKRIGEG